MLRNLTELPGTRCQSFQAVSEHPVGRDPMSFPYQWFAQDDIRTRQGSGRERCARKGGVVEFQHFGPGDALRRLRRVSSASKSACSSPKPGDDEKSRIRWKIAVSAVRVRASSMVGSRSFTAACTAVCHRRILLIVSVCSITTPTRKRIELELRPCATEVCRVDAVRGRPSDPRGCVRRTWQRR